jgi:hypothetical protein
MKRTLLTMAVVGSALVSGWVGAQTPGGARSPPAAKAQAKDAAHAAPMARPRGKMGRGMHGEGMGMGGMCPLMAGPGTKVEVKNLPKGVTITLTNDDADTVARVQKMAEAMRLMHEAHAPQK